MSEATQRAREEGIFLLRRRSMLSGPRLFFLFHLLFSPLLLLLRLLLSLAGSFGITSSLCVSSFFSFSFF